MKPTAPLLISRFVGRDACLQMLRDMLMRDRIAVIVGARGSGKTATAQDYIRRFARHYRRVIWINADTPETLLAETVSAAQRLQLHINLQQDLAGIFGMLHTWLNTQQGSLLVLDNATLQRMEPLAPPNPQPGAHVVMISRTLSTPSEVPRLGLDLLAAEESASLVIRRSGQYGSDVLLDQLADEQRKAALELGSELLGLPLALTLAGGYLAATGCSMQEYLRAYRDHAAQMEQQQQHSSDRATQAITATCQVALSHLQEARPVAYEILSTCAFFRPDAISVALLQQVCEQKSELFSGAKDTLLVHGLLTADDGAHGVSMQSQVQSIVRQTMPLDEQQRRVECILSAYHQLLPSIETETLAIRLYAAGHIRHLAELSMEWPLAREDAAAAFDWAAWLLWQHGMVREAEFLLSRALAIWERAMGHVHPTVARALLNLATLNALLGNYSLAESLAQRAVVTISHALGIGHPDVLLSLDNLGQIYARQDHLDEAKSCYQKALDIGDRCKLQDHPVYVATMYDLALVDIRQTAYSAAQPLIEQVCSAWDRSPGMDQNAIIRAWHHLAEVSLHLEDWPQAEAAYRRVLPAYEASLGKEHPETLHCQEALAHAVLGQGKFDEAEDRLRQLLRVREKSLGTGHSDTAACLHSLAKVALAREQFADALSLIERAQQIYASQPKSDALALASIQDTLAVVYSLQADYTQAIATLQRALESRERMVGKEHLDLIANLSDLATLYLILDQPDQAEPLLLRVLTIFQQAQRPDDVALDPVLEHLAAIEMAREHYTQAQVYLERLGAIRSQALGEDDPDTAQVMQQLGVIAIAQEQWGQAERLSKQALAVYDHQLGSVHPLTLDCLEQMADLYARTNRPAEAETALKRVVAAKQQTLGAAYPDLVEDLLTLGRLCVLQNRFIEAEGYLRRILSLDKQAPKVSVLAIAQLADDVIAALEEIGHHQQAAIVSQEAQACIEHMLRER